MNSAVMPRSRIASPYVKEFKYECLRALRAPGFALPTLLLPVVFYVFFGILIIEDANPEIDRFVFVGFATLAAMGPALFAFGVSVAIEREHGVLTLKRALPMPPSAYLLGRMGMTALFAAVATLVLAAIAVAAGRVSIDAAQIAGFVVVNVLGSLPFAAMGLVVGVFARARSAPVIVNFLFLPLIYLSGILLPLPQTLESIQAASPAFHLSRLLLPIVGATTETAALEHVAVLVAVTLLLGAIALRRLARRGR